MWLCVSSHQDMESPSTPHLSWAGCDLPWPIEARVTTCQFQAQASRDLVHVHGLSWNRSTGVRKKLRPPAGWLLTELSHPSKALLQQPTSSQRPWAQDREACPYQPSPAQPRSAELPKMYHTLWETMNGWCFQTLSLGVFRFTAMVAKTVSMYINGQSALGKILRKTWPPWYRNKINPSSLNDSAGISWHVQAFPVGDGTRMSVKGHALSHVLSQHHLFSPSLSYKFESNLKSGFSTRNPAEAWTGLNWTQFSFGILKAVIWHS